MAVFSLNACRYVCGNLNVKNRKKDSKTCLSDRTISCYFRGKKAYLHFKLFIALAIRNSSNNSSKITKKNYLLKKLLKSLQSEHANLIHTLNAAENIYINNKQ